MVRGYPMMSAVISVVLLLGLVVLPGTPAHGADNIVTIATYSDLRYKELKEQIGPSIEKKYPGIKIKVETAPGGQYWTKLYTMAASKEAPDIFDTAGTYFFEFVLADALVNLTPYIKRDIQMEDYFAPPWVETRYPYRTGDYYAVPYMWVASLLYYNRDAFDASALNYPDEAWDWGALLAAARKLTKDTNGDGRIDMWGFYGHTSHELFDPMVRSFGGEVLNDTRTAASLNNLGARRALEFLTSMIHKEHVAPPPGVDGSFHLRRSAMTIGGSYTINYTYRAITSFDWDVAMVPKGPSGRVLYGGTNTWAVMKRPGQDIETVWKVVKELIGEQALGSFLGGWVPVMRSVALSDKWMERNLPPKNKVALLKSAPYMRDADFSPNWSQWQAAKNRELAPAMAGTRSVEASLVAAEAAINQVIQTFARKK